MDIVSLTEEEARAAEEADKEGVEGDPALGADLMSGIFQEPVDEPAVYDAFEYIVGGIELPGATHYMASDGIVAPIPTPIDYGAEMPLDPSTLICMRDVGRPQCRHYVRQMLSLGGNSDHQQVHRLCMMRQGASGAFVDVSGGVWGCDLRDPPDTVTQKRLDDFDDRKIAEGKQRVAVPLFCASPKQER